MFGFYMQREWADFWRSPVRILAIAIYAGVAFWALMDGLTWQSHVQEIQAETPADMFTDREAWMADLRRAEAGEEVSPYSARPMALTLRAVHMPGDLAALAHRNEAIHPHSALISGWRSEASLFRRYEVEGPSVLRSGRIDLAFVVIVLMPLFLLMLTFDVVSRERVAGRFRVFLMQGGSLSRLLAARLLAVSVPLVLIPAACVLIASAVKSASPVSGLIWLAAITAYALFWAGVSAMIAVLTERPASGAIAVLVSWSVFVVLIPSASQFLAQSLHPVPSRVTYLSEARDAEGQTRRNLAQRAEIYMAEHPGQGGASDDAVPGFYRASYLANVDINSRTAPLVAEFEDQQSAQRQFVNAVGFLSPSMMAQDLLFRASGTGPERAAAFRQQARAHLAVIHEAIGPATVNRSRITVAQAEAIPEFRFAPPGHGPILWISFIWLVVAGGLLVVATAGVARRY
ncbi:DUF3526 domain-containing protein [Hyphobacterium sp.]|uniref:DUF3526 domain-containing protein n=1 Tax=Hyphobacterium sp. TaxID=2004662 RepID=UPI003749B9CA